ncbi:MAG TPA: NUDIX hydrolase [Terriglobales bacterium]|jgi:8-oxo-dGTP diphosphatase|nr:NUDIX hydrolase [Terriglobales bacterium]
MKREYPESPLVGVGAVIVARNHNVAQHDFRQDDPRVLLIRRGTAPLLGEWSLPGGVLECGETLREAVAREAFEETGLLVEPTEMLGVYERIIRGEGIRGNAARGDVIRNDDARVRYHFVLIDFLCHPIGGDLKAGSDAADVRWFMPEELPSLNLANDTSDVVHKGLAQAEI